MIECAPAGCACAALGESGGTNFGRAFCVLKKKNVSCNRRSWIYGVRRLQCVYNVVLFSVLDR